MIKRNRRKSTEKKKKLESKTSEGIILRIKETRIQGTEYENKVLKVCSESGYAFTFHDGRIGGKVPDFIKGKKIIEVYNPMRSDEEVHARLLAFHIKGFKVRQLVMHDLFRSDWQPFLTRIIGRFLNQ